MTLTRKDFLHRTGRQSTLRHRNAIWALAVTILVAGCASPIGIRIADPREVQVYLARSALTADEPSDTSLNELRPYDLLQPYKDDPEAALAKLRAYALAEGLPPDALFALAELSFLRAEDKKETILDRAVARGAPSATSRAGNVLRLTPPSRAASWITRVLASASRCCWGPSGDGGTTI